MKLYHLKFEDENGVEIVDPPFTIDDVVNCLTHCSDAMLAEDLNSMEGLPPVKAGTHRKKQIPSCGQNNVVGLQAGNLDENHSISQDSIHLTHNGPRGSVDLDSSRNASQNCRRKSGGTFVGHLIYNAMNLFGLGGSSPSDNECFVKETPSQEDSLNTEAGNQLMVGSSERLSCDDESIDSSILTSDDGTTPQKSPPITTNSQESETYSQLVVIDSISQKIVEPPLPSTSSSVYHKLRPNVKHRVITRAMKNRPQSTQKPFVEEDVLPGPSPVIRALRKRPQSSQKVVDASVIEDTHKINRMEILQETSEPINELSKFILEPADRTYLLDYVLRNV